MTAQHALYTKLKHTPNKSLSSQTHHHLLTYRQNKLQKLTTIIEKLGFSSWCILTYHIIHLNVYAKNVNLNKLSKNEQAHQAQILCSHMQKPGLHHIWHIISLYWCFVWVTLDTPRRSSTGPGSALGGETGAAGAAGVAATGASNESKWKEENMGWFWHL